jgi:hypothetical protein
VLDLPGSYPLIIGKETSAKPRRGADFGGVTCAFNNEIIMTVPRIVCGANTKGIARSLLTHLV